MPRIRVPADLKAWNAAGDGYLPGLIGLEFDRVDAREVVARLQVRQALSTWNGFLHAATVVALADTACGYGTVASLPDDADGFTTIELKSNFLGTAREGEIKCVAKPLHQGRTTQLWDAVVTRLDTGRAIAHFRCTQMILRAGR